MRETITIWGQEDDAEVLIAIKLLLNNNKVKIWTFDKKNVTEEFEKELGSKWAEGFENNFNNIKSYVERNISEENLLPDNFKTTKTDVIKVAEQEWRVRVISHKLFEQTNSQVDELKTRANSLDNYSKTLWDECIIMSNRIKDYSMDRTLPKDYITKLRNNLDSTFDDMKKLMTNENSKFNDESNDRKKEFIAKINEISGVAVKQNNNKKTFNELIALQQQVKGIDLLAKHRGEIRKVFNTAFEAIKNSNNKSYKDKLKRRISGLEEAIKKMETSVKSDKSFYQAQHSKLEKNAVSQLEYQLRGAKLKLIEEKINSKTEKLNSMYLLLKELKDKNEKIVLKQQTKTNNNDTKEKTNKKEKTETAAKTDKPNQPATETKTDNVAVSKKPETSEKAEAKTTEVKSTQVNKVVQTKTTEVNKVAEENKTSEIKQQVAATIEVEKITTSNANNNLNGTAKNIEKTNIVNKVATAAAILKENTTDNIADKVVTQTEDKVAAANNLIAQNANWEEE